MVLITSANVFWKHAREFMMRYKKNLQLYPNFTETNKVDTGTDEGLPDSSLFINSEQNTNNRAELLSVEKDLQGY
jgi:hypothetical protein